MDNTYYDFDLFRKRRDALKTDVIRHCYFDDWARITGNRSLDERPERLKNLHHQFEALCFGGFPLTEEQAENWLEELARVRDALKGEYKSLEERGVNNERA